jgi:hypothetical protein
MTTSSKNVLILRALIALCKRDIKLPSDLYDLGYTQVAMDKKIRLEDDRSVMPDLIISSEKTCWYKSKGFPRPVNAQC